MKYIYIITKYREMKMGTGELKQIYIYIYKKEKSRKYKRWNIKCIRRDKIK